MKLPPTAPLRFHQPMFISVSHVDRPTEVKPAVYQDRYGPNGNCLAACLATLLEIELDQVRPFHQIYLQSLQIWEKMDNWEQAAYVHQHGETLWQIELSVFLIPYGKTPAYPMATSHDVRRLPPAGWSIALGDSKNGGGHACVALDGELVHDPNPRKVKGAADWGLRSIEHYVVLLEGVQ